MDGGMELQRTDPGMCPTHAVAWDCAVSTALGVLNIVAVLYVDAA